MRPGVRLGQVNAFLGSLSWRPDEDVGRAGGPSDFAFQARGLRERFSAAGLRQMLALLLGAVLVVLTIAAANVATLQLARTEARQRELVMPASSSSC